MTPPFTFRTLRAASEGCYSEKRSRFLAFALPVRTPDDAREAVKEYRRKYRDARHVCWAYMLGAERTEFRVNDDGEPSSTAGRPILGQINSAGLTDVIIIVIRYFGGIELGTSGLAAAYRTAAAEAIAAAKIEERTVNGEISITFEYPYLNSVMRIIKEEQPEVVAQTIDMQCIMTLRTGIGRMDILKSRLLKVETVKTPD